MLEPLKVRGPDAAGKFTDDAVSHHVELAHRRLKILDLSDAANQPMSRGEFTIVFNGAIYNFVELRGRLRALGHTFETESDTEVLLASFREWGADCLQHLNGMFAFAIWDEDERELFCARDRVGEKPFYYWNGAEGFVFASEIKSVLRYAGPVPREPNWDRVVEYMDESWQRRSEDTFFVGVRELPAGHWLRVRVDGTDLRVEQRRYWEMPTASGGGLTAERIRELLDDAVQLRLRSDVPIGTSLSGGVDSPSVVAAVRAVSEGTKIGAQFRYVGVHAYADAEGADEREFVELVGQDLDLELAMVELEGERCNAELDELVYRQDEPFLSPSIFAQRRVFCRAKELGLKVMLDGQGADELFGGYDWAVPKALAITWRERGLGALLGQVRSFRGSRFPLLKLLRQVVLCRTRNSAIGLPDDLHAALRASLFELSLPALLRFADRNSMTYGIETRLPFLDHRLIEASVELTAEDCVRDGMTKALLRDAMRGRVPERVLARRDKTAYAVPEQQWIRGPLAAAVRAAADDAIWDELPNGDRYRRRALAELEGRSYDRSAWKLLCVSRWHDRFFIHRT